jgi:ribosomal protein S18 acetylase RimI-like enzyme
MRLREAREGDAAFLAWVMLTASRSHVERGIWEFINDQGEAQLLPFLERLALSDAVHWCHYSRFLVAEEGGRSAAALCGFDPSTHGQHAMQPVVARLMKESGIQAHEIPDIVKRVSLVETVTPDYADGAWVVENVAADPDFRRRGLVDALLSAMLERGRALGFQRAQIAVFIGNEPARQAYLKAGFQRHDEKRNPEFEAALGFPGMERLLQPL